jgi:hypothetical protein
MARLMNTDATPQNVSAELSKSPDPADKAILLRHCTEVARAAHKFEAEASGGGNRKKNSKSTIGRPRCSVGRSHVWMS